MDGEYPAAGTTYGPPTWEARARTCRLAHGGLRWLPIAGSHRRPGGHSASVASMASVVRLSAAGGPGGRSRSELVLDPLVAAHQLEVGDRHALREGRDVGADQRQLGELLVVVDVRARGDVEVRRHVAVLDHAVVADHRA